MLRKLSILLGVFVLSVALVACGNNNTADEENEPEMVEEIEDDTDALEEEIENEEDETVDPLAADNERLINWINTLVLEMEEMGVEDRLSFVTSLAGIISGSEAAMEEVNISTYLSGQMDNILEIFRELRDFVNANDDETLDLVEMRDFTIGTLNGLIDVLTTETPN